MSDRYTIEIRALQDEIQVQRRRGSLPTDVRRLASLRHQEIEQELETILMQDGYEDHVLDYLSTEQTRLREGDRDKPLCACGRSSCPIKNAEIPSQVRLEDSFEQGLLRYKHRHPATPHALLEARESWVSRKASVKAELQEVLYAYSSGTVTPRLLDSLTSDPTGVDVEQFEEQSSPSVSAD